VVAGSCSTVLFVLKEGLSIFEIRATILQDYPAVRLQGLLPDAQYTLKGRGRFSEPTLMNAGIVTECLTVMVFCEDEVRRSCGQNDQFILCSDCESRFRITMSGCSLYNYSGRKGSQPNER
jgi:hypothetical protein